MGGKGMEGKPWFGVLGNHDWGGIGWNTGWDTQIFHTWNNPTWRLPALFWSQNVQYEGFSIDFFMLESNFQDAHKPASLDPHHNICQDNIDKSFNSDECFGMTLDNCADKFLDWWQESLTMLEQGLKESTATWKIINTHYPGPVMSKNPELMSLHKKIWF